MTPPPLAPKAPEIVGRGPDTPPNYPGFLSRLGKELNRGDGIAAKALWVGAFGLLFLGPPVLIYKALKRKKGSNLLPLAAAVGLPLGYFLYSANQHDREVERRKQAGEDAK